MNTLDGLNAAALYDQEGEEISPVTLVGTMMGEPGVGIPYWTGGGWEDGPGMTDSGKVFIVGTGFGFEKTKCAQERGGKKTFLANNCKWLTNYLKSLKGTRPVLGTKDADELEGTIRATFEWHLNGAKAQLPLWKCPHENVY